MVVAIKSHVVCRRTGDGPNGFLLSLWLGLLAMVPARTWVPAGWELTVVLPAELFDMLT